MKKTIQVKCKAATSVPLDVILEFQGNLKKITKENLEKLKKNILKNGFIAPVFVWDDKGDYKLLDGHQRLAALISLRKENYDIPMIPVDIINAKDELEAKKMLLSITSQYGEFEIDELKDWLDQVDDETINFIRLVENEIDINKTTDIDILEEKKELYSTKIKAPIYEIKGNKPIVENLINKEKYETLVKKIEQSTIDLNVKEFLKYSAARHIVFKYQDIAEYYAHSAKEIQELMEESALVIVDYNKAIDNGFVRMINEIEKLRGKDAE